MELASTRIQRAKRRRSLFFFLLIITILFFAYRSISANNRIISPIPETAMPTQPPNNPLNIFAKKKSVDDLTEKIEAAIGDEWQNYSIMVEDYTSPFTIALSETEIYTAASINKIPILAALYYYAQKGDIDLDETITLQSQDIQDYGTGSLRYEKPGSTYSIKTLAKLMIKQSDNTAAYILANHIIGFPKLTAIVNEWGLAQTDMVDNKTSNRDIALLMRKIYEEKVTDKAHTLEMLSFLKDTDFETRLPAKLPDGVTTYHKIGTEVGVVHDVGIVTDGKHTYYIGVFTSDVTDDPTTDELIAQISQLVYNYMK